MQELKKKIEENKNEFLNQLEELKSQFKNLKEIEKYAREKIIIEEKEEIIDKKKENTYKRELKLNSSEVLNLDISIYLFEEKIKFIIKEIQDNLKSYPLIYEASLAINDFHKIGDYFMKNGGIEEIFNLLCDLLENKKDTINKGDNKIIIEIKFPLALKEEEISLNINLKKFGLQMTLKNIDQSLKEINKENIKNNKKLEETKKEFEKNLLEKVYPIGSYYWSEKNIDPGDIFGGTWSKIQGRFLFSSDNSHSVGSIGGEERVKLSLNQIPNHQHNYNEFTYNQWYCARTC